ncbi:MAG: polysaccharide biosynthesis C-terminal domain-containing protein [Bacteroidota bacterium]|nr:polysaccharide biosynthesis C-terminal domain-containing protein [Bacteroidota bacterium]
MGTIRNQSIKSVILTYSGFAIGAINMMFVMPYFFSNIQIGLTQIFTALATQIVAVGSIGMAVVVNKFMPYYKVHLEAAQRDLLTIILVVGTVGMLLTLGLVMLNEDFIIRKFSKNSLLFVNYLYLFPLFAFGYFYYSALDAFNNNYKYTVWSSFVRELFFKSFNLLIVLVFAIGWISFKGFMYTFTFIYWLGALLIAINLIRYKLFHIPFKISSLTKRIRHKIMQYALSSWGISILSVASQFVGTFAIAALQGLGQTAIFSIASFIITPIIMPSSAVISASVPFVSEAWRENDTAKINLIYKKSALILVLTCGFLFFIIWSNIDDILHLLPNKFYGSQKAFEDAKYVVLFLGLARMCDFATSINSYIMQNSRKHYWMDLYSNIFLILMMIPLNYLMIKKFGILGAAYASFIAFFIVNGFKALYLYIKEKMHPFSKQWRLLFLLFLVSLVFRFLVNLVLELPALNNLISNNITLILRIGVRSLALCGLIIPLIYWFKISLDINDVVDSSFYKLRQYIKK